MIFDTHAHYDDEAFEEDLEDVMEQLKGCVKGIINSGASLKSSRSTIELAHRYDFVYGSVGVHPDDAGELEYEQGGRIVRNEAAYEELKRLALDPRTVAVGEIGLDYHWDRYSHEIQKAAFCGQWELADSLGLPVVIHSRDAAADTLELIKSRFEKNAGKPLRAVMHCYSYSPEQALEYLKMGLYFGIGGVLTFKNAKKLLASVELIPMDRILLETDTPYLAPEPHRGSRNNSSYLSFVAQKLAEIKGITPEEVYEITCMNAQRLFDRIH